MTEPSAAIEHLLSVLSRMGPKNHPDYKKVIPHCRRRVAESAECLYRPGESASEVYFVHAGLVRVFNTTDSGEKEFNKSFITEGQFVGALWSPLRLEASPYYIEAMETSELLAIPRSSLDVLYQSSIVWANIGRVYMEHLAITKEQREAQLLTGTAEQRYLRFLQQYPHLVGRVPLYHVASYLGVTDVALSRIRRRLNLG